MKAFINLLLPTKFREYLGASEKGGLVDMVQTSTGCYYIIDLDQDLYEDWMEIDNADLHVKIEIDVEFTDLTFHLEGKNDFLSSGSMIFDYISISDLEYTFNCPDFKEHFSDRDFEDSNLELCDTIAKVISWMIVDKYSVKAAVTQVERLQ